jgi:hypothetical protein
MFYLSDKLVDLLYAEIQTRTDSARDSLNLARSVATTAALQET